MGHKPSSAGSSDNSCFGQRAVGLSGAAARLLGWRPSEFWVATPAELAAALQHEMIEPVGNAELERLRERFPDG